MTPIFADTSYYVALLNTNDSAHGAAAEFAATFKGQTLTTGWVLTELANLLSPPQARGRFLACYQRLQADMYVLILPPSDEGLTKGIEFYARHQDKDWSLTDCISFLAMKEFGSEEALTTDHHFEQAGFRALLR